MLLGRGKRFLQAGDLNQDGTTDLIVAGGSGTLFLSTPIATIFPDFLNFGTLKVGRTSPAKTITVANNGNAPLIVSAVTVPPAYHVIDNCGSSLPARSSCTLKVTFRPTVPGSDPGVLTLNDNAPGGFQNVALSGQGK